MSLFCVSPGIPDGKGAYPHAAPAMHCRIKQIWANMLP